MPRLHPFRALRYTTAAGEPSEVLAPPYDVIDASMADVLRERSLYNAVRLVLPQADDGDRYQAAADAIAEWTGRGILARDEEPSVYVYRQRYERDGENVQRLALFAALDLVPLDAGEVLPHEETHAGPKADRLALTVATRTQLSPIFLLGRDPDEHLLEALRAATGGTAEFVSETSDGIEHALWTVAEEGAAELLCAVAGRHPLLIADGHHRYETALEAARRIDAAGVGRMLVCVVSDRDPGLVIQPTHRTLTALGTIGREGLREELGRWFEVAPLDEVDPVSLGELAARDPGRLVAALPASDGREPESWLLEARVGEEPKIAARLFERIVMGELLGTNADAAARDGLLSYHRHAAEAVRAAGSEGAAFLLPPVALDAVWDVTARGVRLPPKSTYFEPKMPSGLLFRPLDEAAGDQR